LTSSSAVLLLLLIILIIISDPPSKLLNVHYPLHSPFTMSFTHRSSCKMLTVHYALHYHFIMENTQCSQSSFLTVHHALHLPITIRITPCSIYTFHSPFTKYSTNRLHAPRTLTLRSVSSRFKRMAINVASYVCQKHFLSLLCFLY
jgi:hypothetical protein